MNKQSENLINKWKKIKRSGHFKRRKLQQVTSILKGQHVARNVSNIDCELNIEVTPSISQAKEVQPPLSTLSLTQQNHDHYIDLDTGNFELKYVKSINEACEKRDFEFDKDKFQSELVCWAIQNEVNNVQLKGLLEIWNKYVPLPQLPVDPRTLLNGNPRMLKIFEEPQNNGQKYWFNGVEKLLLIILQCIPSENIPTEIQLNMSADGLPISDSSTESFWPILFNITEFPNIKPFVAGIYLGKRKFVFV